MTSSNIRAIFTRHSCRIVAVGSRGKIGATQPLDVHHEPLHMPTPSRHPFAIFFIAISAVIFCATALFSLNSLAQTRDFPASALRGSLQVTLPPQVELDGKADQLSPGARIHGTNNLLVLSGTLVGQTMWVNYTRDTSGLLSEVWILTEAEAALDRAGTKPKRFFFF